MCLVPPNFLYVVLVEFLFYLFPAAREPAVGIFLCCIMYNFSLPAETEPVAAAAEISLCSVT